MTRDDLSFLIEKATGLVLLVIGLECVADLIDVIGGAGTKDAPLRRAALRAVIPLAAGAFLLLRKKPAAAASDAASSSSPITAAMTRVDWLWVGCKLLGAFAMLYGAGNLVLVVSWATEDFPPVPAAGAIVQQAINLLGGAWLFFGTRAWRFACRG